MAAGQSRQGDVERAGNFRGSCLRLHDVHMAIWVGTAKALLAMKDKWHGTFDVRGPAVGRDRERGLWAMLADGLYTRFGKPNYAVAIHDMPEAAGTVMWRFGATTTTADSLDITFLGRGGHGAMPERTIDPVVMAARFIEDVQTVISREKDPAAFGPAAHRRHGGGSARNIIPDQAVLVWHDPEADEGVRTKMPDGIRRTANGVAAIAARRHPRSNCRWMLMPLRNTRLSPAGPLRSSSRPLARLAEQMAITPASEDFSEFLRAGVPGTFFTVGATDPKLVAAAAAGGAPVPGNHSPCSCSSRPSSVLAWKR